MNIIYKFTSTVTGKFYIGSKTECTVSEGTIFCNKSGTKYFSSSSSEDFWDEVADGNMVLEVLEVVGERLEVLPREAEYQLDVDAKNNPNCYNLSTALDFRSVANPEGLASIVNVYKETVLTKTTNNSRVVRLNSAAVREGFINYGDKVHKYLLKFEELGTYKAVDSFYGRGKYANRFIRGLSLEDFNTEVDIVKVKEHLMNGASYLRAVEECGYKLHVVMFKCYKEFSAKLDIRDYIAVKNGLSDRSELGKEILKLYVKGNSHRDIINSFPELSSSSIARILQVEVSKRINFEDV